MYKATTDHQFREGRDECGMELSEALPERERRQRAEEP